MGVKLYSLGKTLLALALGVGYSYCLLFVTVSFLGAGHGPDAPFRLVTAPMYLGLLVWPATFVFWAFPKRKICRVAGILVLLAQYVGSAIELAARGSSVSLSQYNTAEERTILLTAMAAVHISVNVGLWMRFTRPPRSP